MRVADFTFELPDSLIARHPLAERRASRLLTLDGVSGAMAHRQFTDLLEHLRPGDLMVFNNTRVIPARLFGQKASGGKLEILVERVLDSHRVLAHVRSSKSPKPGSSILIDGGGEAVMVARHDALFELAFAEEVLPLLDRVGHMPLPPYIDRPDEGSTASVIRPFTPSAWGRWRRRRRGCILISRCWRRLPPRAWRRRS